jgi:7-keto-8-aminopelargonate synthetase-like enzyme
LYYENIQTLRRTALDLFDKCRNFTRAQQARTEGWYPYFKAIESGADSEVVIDGRKLVMIGSNNYLGLTQDPRVKEAAIKAVETFGSGCTGSRFLNGTLALHEELEHTVVGKDDLIFTDRANHASIVDGCRLSFGRTIKFKHNDLNDLERLLKRHDAGTGKLIVADGVFSMEGDIIDLPNLAPLAEKYGARIMLDDAHSIGVLGKHGRGTGEHFGLESKVDIVMGTFSKSFASLGGFIAADAYVIDYIKHHARALIFSASMPPASTASVLAALDIIEQEPHRIECLWKNAHKMKTGFDALGFDTGKSVTPIIPILVGDDMKTFAFWKLLFDNGIFANPVITPAVPPGQGRIRTSYMATHTDAELDHVLHVFARLGREFGLIA